MNKHQLLANIAYCLKVRVPSNEEYLMPLSSFLIMVNAKVQNQQLLQSIDCLEALQKHLMILNLYG